MAFPAGARGLVVVGGSLCGFAVFRRSLSRAKNHPPVILSERVGAGLGAKDRRTNPGAVPRSARRSLSPLGPTHPSLRGCEEIARRKVGVILSENGPNCRGARLCVRPQVRPRAQLKRRMKKPLNQTLNWLKAGRNCVAQRRGGEQRFGESVGPYDQKLDLAW